MVVYIYLNSEKTYKRETAVAAEAAEAAASCASKPVAQASALLGGQRFGCAEKEYVSTSRQRMVIP